MAYFVKLNETIFKRYLSTLEVRGKRHLEFNDPFQGPGAQKAIRMKLSKPSRGQLTHNAEKLLNELLSNVSRIKYLDVQTSGP